MFPIGSLYMYREQNSEVLWRLNLFTFEYIFTSWIFFPFVLYFNPGKFEEMSTNQNKVYAQVPVEIPTLT